MEFELEEVERDYIEFRKEMGEYDIDLMKNGISVVMTDVIESLS